MIWYILVSALALYCFEIIGRYVLYVLKIDKIKCCFGIGLIVFLAYAYITTSLITALDGSFYLICVIYSLFFLVSLYLVAKNRKNISFKINLSNLIILIVFETILLLYAYNTSLGELDGYDTTFYLNVVTSNIKANRLNFSYFKDSIAPITISNQYKFQSFYYIASFVSYIFAPIISIFHRTYYQTVYIWVFQIIFNAFFCSLIINSLELMKTKNKKIVSILIFLLFTFVYGRIFFYNVYGFYGNTFEIITTGYLTLLLYLLTKSEKNDSLMILFIGSLIASAAVSSSGLFIDIFIMFATYFVLCNKYDNIIKYYSFALVFILTDLLSIISRLGILVSLLTSIVISVFLFIFGNFINRILSNKKSLIIILSISFLFMFIASYLTTGNIFDYFSFFVNYSEWCDATINYFHLSSSTYIFYLKIFILSLIFSSFFMVKKEPFVRFTLILFICIFNPFCTGFIYSILIVFFRAFVIIVNPFTIVLYIDYLLRLIYGNKILKFALYIFILFVSLQNNPLKPYYYHDSFDPKNSTPYIECTNYNREFKMSQDEKDVIDILYNDIFYYDIKTPYIITPNLLTQSVITNGRYLFNRGQHPGCPYVTESEIQLYTIFYPEKFMGDHYEGAIPNYKKIKEYLEDAKIDYLVVDKTKQFFNEDTNLYSFVFYKVLEDYQVMYDNDRYTVFRCFE